MSAQKPLLNDAGRVRPFHAGEFIAVAYGGTGATDAAGARTALGLGSGATLDVDTDNTLAANSDAKVPSQKAVKTYVDNAVTGLWDLKGSTDCSGNPNYPSALKGDAYVVSVAGKIGGGSGRSVDIGDVYVALADNAGGTEASVGASWVVIEHNLAGALTTADIGSLVQAFSAVLTTYAGINPTANVQAILGAANYAAIRTLLGLGTVYSLDADTDGTLAANSDSKVATQKAVKTYVASALTGSAARRVVQIAVTDPAGDALTTGDGKAYFRVPSDFNGLNLVEVALTVTTVSSSGIPTFQIANVTDGVDMLSTKLTVDANETDSATAAAAAVIDTAHDDVATADLLRIDCDVAGTGAKGVIVTMIFA